jgi:hypothetical protein
MNSKETPGRHKDVLRASGARRIARALLVLAEAESRATDEFYIEKLRRIRQLRDLDRNELRELYKKICEAIPISRKAGQSLKKLSHWDNYFGTVLRWLNSGSIRAEDMPSVHEVLHAWYEKRSATFGRTTELQTKQLSDFESPGDVRVFLKNTREIKIAPVESTSTENKEDGGFDIGSVESFEIPQEVLDKLKVEGRTGPFTLYEFTGPKDIRGGELGKHLDKSGWCIRPSYPDGGVQYSGETYHLVTHKNRGVVLMEKESAQIKDVHDRALNAELATAIAPLIRIVFPKPPMKSVSEDKREATRLHHLVQHWTPQKHRNFDVVDFLHYFTSQHPPQRLSNYLLPPLHGKSDIMAVYPYVWAQETDDKVDPNEILDEIRAALNKSSKTDDRSLFLLATYYAIEHGFWSYVSKDIKREAEKKADLGVLYAMIVKNRVSKEMERVIATEPVPAADYSINIMKKRWPEAEDTIKKNKRQWERYCDHFDIKDDAAK